MILSLEILLFYVSKGIQKVISLEFVNQRELFQINKNVAFNSMRIFCYIEYSFGFYYKMNILFVISLYGKFVHCFTFQKAFRSLFH